MLQKYYLLSIIIYFGTIGENTYRKKIDSSREKDRERLFVFKIWGRDSG